ncbi:hypothetical protein B0T14DRAFT_557459 [Immersiella caudata]|uniref:ATP-dependent RNA helicase n=1 Tax=Immersiella caudata TaxID=314043 RepID=A0AA40BUG8_9PEZI|nr:hypothetical protein B0T14DRAFT_557459 [Immersiella caudata]
MSMELGKKTGQNSCPRTPNNPIIPIMIHVDHYYLFIAQRLKDACLVHLCNEAQAANQTTAIFTQSISETRRVSHLLDALKIRAVSLHCDLSLSERAASLGKLRRKECPVIVTTDIAANLGPTMIPMVNRIINYGVTAWRMTPNTYTQRTSHIAHTENPGQVITFITEYDVEFCLRLKDDLALKEHTVNMDTVMTFREQVKEAAREDPSLIESPFLQGRGRN